MSAQLLCADIQHRHRMVNSRMGAVCVRVGVLPSAASCTVRPQCRLQFNSW